MSCGLPPNPHRSAVTVNMRTQNEEDGDERDVWLERLVAAHERADRLRAEQQEASAAAEPVSRCTSAQMSVAAPAARAALARSCRDAAAEKLLHMLLALLPQRRMQHPEWWHDEPAAIVELMELSHSGSYMYDSEPEFT